MNFDMLLLTAFIASLSILRTSSSNKIHSTQDALGYLSHFGYLPDLNSHPNVSVQDAKQALSEFQDFVNVIPNGRLNRRTFNKLNMPRCGNRDKRIEQGDEFGIDVKFQAQNQNAVRISRKKREDSPGVRWHKRILTYRVAKFSSKSLKPKALQKEIDLAFKYWESEANITFKKVWEGKPDIEISFVVGDHGDEESFKGPSKTLAHAFYPARSDIHFDDAKKWTVNTRSNGHNLQTVAVHEIGHSLGLGHSKEKGSVMYLMYQGFKEKLQLHPVDKFAIQSLYGPKVSKEIPNNYSPKFQKLVGMVPNPESVDLCTRNASIDAISTLSDGLVYVFKGDFYYRLEMGKRFNFSDNPKRINETFQGLPSNLDTVLTIDNGKTYYFKGKLYWRSRGTQMDKGYPKLIQTNFIGIPNNLDASFIWSWNNQVYFFKKNRYWKYNFDQEVKGYPKKISTNWQGLLDGIEDAFKAPNGRTYFFKGGEYWQFHDSQSVIEAASYPRLSNEWWFLGCSEVKTKKNRHARKRNKSPISI